MKHSPSSVTAWAERCPGGAEVAPLKGALHVHSTLSDGQLTPEELAEKYEALGFDFLAITDHDFLVRPDYREKIPAGRNNLLIFAGIELTVFEKGYVHVNRIFGDKEVLHVFNHPAEYDLTFPEVVEVLESVAKKFPIDAVEVSSKGFYTPEFDDDRIPYPKVASDDSHTDFGCGRAWIEVDCKLDRDEIIRAIKAGRAKPCFE